MIYEVDLSNRWAGQLVYKISYDYHNRIPLKLRWCVSNVWGFFFLLRFYKNALLNRRVRVSKYLVSITPVMLPYYDRPPWLFSSGNRKNTVRKYIGFFFFFYKILHNGALSSYAFRWAPAT